MPISTITRVDRSKHNGMVVPSEHAETQAFGLAKRTSLALDENTALASIDSLNQLLADTLTMRDLYKKHHWQASGKTFYMIHLLFDKHANEQTALADVIAERVQTLGGVSIAMGVDVAETTIIPRAPKGREDTPTQLKRLIHAHEIILLECRAMARDTATSGDIGTNDLIVSEVLRDNELQSWFLSEHIQ